MCSISKDTVIMKNCVNYILRMQGRDSYVKKFGFKLLNLLYTLTSFKIM